MPKRVKNSGTGVSGVSGGSSQVQATQQKPGKPNYAKNSEGPIKYPKPYQPVDASSHGNTSTPPARVASGKSPLIPVKPMPLYNKGGQPGSQPRSFSLNAVAPKGRAADSSTKLSSVSPPFPRAEGVRKGSPLGAPLTAVKQARRPIRRKNAGTKRVKRGF